MALGLSLTGRLDLAGAKLTRTDARDWLARAAVWFETVGDAVLDAAVVRDADDRSVLCVSFHPVVDDLEVRVSAAGAVKVSAPTFAAGPGYHAHLCEVFEAFADDFDFTWDHVDDPTGFFRSADLPALHRHYLEALRRKCRELAESAAEWGDEPVPIGLPPDHGFTHPGPVLTPTGPQPRAWLAAVAADPASGRDFFPWWSPDLDAAFYTNRAVALMWCEFPWRPPLTDDEGELTDQIAADLATAYGLQPGGAYPWRAWAEVIAAIEADTHALTVEPIDPALKAEVLKNAAAAADAPVGYRRLPVRVPLGGGWTVEVPGSFAEGWAADGTWLGWDDRRRVVARIGDGTGPAEPAFGELQDDAGRRVWRLVAVTADGDAGATCFVDVPDAGDRPWAEAVWRSLRCKAA